MAEETENKPNDPNTNNSTPSKDTSQVSVAKEYSVYW